MIRPYFPRILTNIKGWRTSRRIIVIESDDWGSIRMPSKEVYEKCLKAGYPVDKISYERYDSLLSEVDIELLFEVLSGYKDKYGNNPIITANCVVANPDFEAIKKNNFEEYHYELITETFRNYPSHAGNFQLWMEGISNNIFFPQFHAREHLNVSLFMEALRKGDRDVHFGFENQMPGCIPIGPLVKGNKYVAATDYNSLKDKDEKLMIFLEGLDIFEDLFGYRSETIIPPNNTWSPDNNEAIFKKGVKFIQGIRKYKEPGLDGNYNYHSSFLGKRNDFGQIHLVRNVVFEPSMFKLGIKDPVGRCLSEIDMAFRMYKPAIISSHRINYAGFIDSTNRDRTLIMLNQILMSILKNWPDAEFMTSQQVGSLINTEAT